MGQWDVTLLAPDGERFQYRFVSGWDPEKVEDELIQRSAATQAWVESGKKTPYQPIRVERFDG